MKRSFTNWALLFCATLISSFAVAQPQDWPKTISASNGDLIKIYQPQPESYTNNTLKSRAAISIIESGKTEPVFGTYWFTAGTASAGNGTVAIQSLQVNDVRFPSDMDDSKIDGIKATLQTEVPKMSIRLSEADLQNALNLNQEQTKLASNLDNNPPKVFYSTKPSMLVLIDGTPRMQMNNDWGVEAVVNSPFTIVKNNDGRFYLYGGKRWFTAPDATGPYTFVPSAPGNLQVVQDAVDKAAADNAASANTDAAAKGDNNPDNDQAATANTVPQIIVSTEPAELIQSNGEPNFSPIEGTGLLYVKNSGNDIFMNVNSQQYFVLLAGRWYKSGNLNGSWQFIHSNELPADFAKIPEGTPKDNVLASVAGTEAANDAVMDAQVPQTAKVDRNTATANVSYDGNPDFENIDGTHLQYSVNSSGSVLRYHGRYYTVDNGVWFESGAAEGPWVVATARPDEVALIPPSYPCYNMQYVNIYDVTPDYCYMGYTPGYLNTYIYGPTIVYGTGYRYHSWYGRYYYPRACTWGFGMGYNPWYGWSVGWDLSFGWFNIGLGGSRWNYWGGGWWGPRSYRPAYFGGGYHNYRSYGYYGPRGRTLYSNNRSVVINRNYTNNVYQNRRDVVTNNNRRFVSNRGGYNNGNRPGGNNDFNRGGGNNNNPGGYNRGRQMNNSNGYNNNRVAPGNNGNNNMSRPSPYNNNNRVAPNNNNNNYSRPNNSPARPQPQQQQQNNNRAPQQQYNRPQPQRTYNAPPPGQQQRPMQRPMPQQQQQRVERPSNGGGGGGSRPSGGGGRPSGGGDGGGRSGGEHGGRRG